VITPAANLIGIGSRVVLLKKRELTTGTKTGEIDPIGTTYGHWQLIYDNTLTATATSLDITGLDGNKACLYRLVTRLVANGATQLQYRFNDDSGANYGRQYLRGNDTTVEASRDTGLTQGYAIIQSTADTRLGMSDSLMYVKSGFNRVIIDNATGSITGTTVTQVEINGETWNNTADNITKLSVIGGLGIGTHISLWRLNL
jgi:hypothetical protein